eukprot:Blabericola_migrator_1__5919@NODE_2995_length_2131_cov_28_073643_g1873_i0_p1_GENE_NODE_2995_length_2131_cov_28_073643_g1873_i0NODE_2995_length_2131_cov_28_073643_g1873_i0_p1_ORF_typecomplete_len563_score91_78Orn_Arg_deC_N/PF02784_16/2_6e12Ala_racemase_N/PF01168_20/1_3e05_NODE_2995_length_2131_cov_28_073643_g1873_i03322020
MSRPRSPSCNMKHKLNNRDCCIPPPIESSSSSCEDNDGGDDDSYRRDFLKRREFQVECSSSVTLYGTNLTELVEKFGTPLNVYLPDRLRTQLEGVGSILELDRIYVHFHDHHVLPIGSDQQGICICNERELNAARDLQINPNHILVSGMLKSKILIELAIKAGIQLYTVETLQEAETLNAVALVFGKTIDVLISVAGSKRLHSNLPYGLSAEDAELVAWRINELSSLRLKGFQLYTSNQSIKSVARGLVATLDLLEKVENAIEGCSPILNIWHADCPGCVEPKEDTGCGLEEIACLIRSEMKSCRPLKLTLTLGKNFLCDTDFFIHIARVVAVRGGKPSHCGGRESRNVPKPQWVAVEGSCDSLLAPNDCRVLNLSRIRSPHSAAVGFVNSLGVGDHHSSATSYKLPVNTKDGDLIAVFDPKCGDKGDACSIAIDTSGEKRLIVLKPQDRTPPMSAPFTPAKEHLTPRDLAARGELKLPHGFTLQADATLGLVRARSRDLVVSEESGEASEASSEDFYTKGGRSLITIALPVQRIKTSSKSPRHRRYELYKGTPKNCNKKCS